MRIICTRPAERHPTCRLGVLAHHDEIMRAEMVAIAV
jgi:hypothetical protein